MVVLPSGEVVKTQRRSRKSSTGFDTTKLFIGAEGTLESITESASLRSPAHISCAFSPFCPHPVCSSSSPIATSILLLSLLLSAAMFVPEYQLTGRTVTICVALLLPTTVAVVHFPDICTATEAIVNSGMGICALPLFLSLSQHRADCPSLRLSVPALRFCVLPDSLHHACCTPRGRQSASSCATTCSCAVRTCMARARASGPRRTHSSSSSRGRASAAWMRGTTSSMRCMLCPLCLSCAFVCTSCAPLLLSFCPGYHVLTICVPDLYEPIYSA